MATAEQIDALARIAWAEAGWADGPEGVVDVIRNRMADPRFASNPISVIEATVPGDTRKEFDPMIGKSAYTDLPAAPAKFKEYISNYWAGRDDGRIVDSSQGALFFVNPDAGRVSFTDQTTSLGRHDFYSAYNGQPGYNGPAIVNDPALVNNRAVEQAAVANRGHLSPEQASTITKLTGATTPEQAAANVSRFTQSNQTPEAARKALQDIESKFARAMELARPGATLQQALTGEQFLTEQLQQAGGLASMFGTVDDARAKAMERLAVLGEYGVDPATPASEIFNRMYGPPPTPKPGTVPRSYPQPIGQDRIPPMQGAPAPFSLPPRRVNEVPINATSSAPSLTYGGQTMRPPAVRDMIPGVGEVGSGLSRPTGAADFGQSELARYLAQKSGAAQGPQAADLAAAMMSRGSIGASGDVRGAGAPADRAAGAANIMRASGGLRGAPAPGGSAFGAANVVRASGAARGAPAPSQRAIGGADLGGVTRANDMGRSALASYIGAPDIGSGDVRSAPAPRAIADAGMVVSPRGVTGVGDTRSSMLGRYVSGEAIFPKIETNVRSTAGAAPPTISGASRLGTIDATANGRAQMGAAPPPVSGVANLSSPITGVGSVRGAVAPPGVAFSAAALDALKGGLTPQPNIPTQIATPAPVYPTAVPQPVQNAIPISIPAPNRTIIPTVPTRVAPRTIGDTRTSAGSRNAGMDRGSFRDSRDVVRSANDLRSGRANPFDRPSDYYEGASGRARASRDAGRSSRDSGRNSRGTSGASRRSGASW